MTILGLVLYLRPSVKMFLLFTIKTTKKPTPINAPLIFFLQASFNTAKKRPLDIFKKVCFVGVMKAFPFSISLFVLSLFLVKHP